MIGLFDSGFGGLTIYQALKSRFPDIPFVYLGDHGNAPYGNKSSQDIYELTQFGVESLFRYGCRLVILACNTATAVAARKLQQDWLPGSEWSGHNVVGIIAPTVEAATQTPWSIKTPQYPQKNNDDVILLFATQRTVSTDVYPEEIHKRCPRVRLLQQDCPHLAGAIEDMAPQHEREALVKSYVDTALKTAFEKWPHHTPHTAILGCTHYPLVRTLFEVYLPDYTRIFCQPTRVADSLEDYLERHPYYLKNTLPDALEQQRCRFLTTGKTVSIPKFMQPVIQDNIIFQKLSPESLV
ncbi:MAG: glutamate racemase [Pseudomonadota bacterium]